MIRSLRRKFIAVTMAIAQGIVTDHGGRIWAESREGLVALSVQLPLKRSEP